MYFEDRFDAAEKLFGKLKEYKKKTNVVVIAIPRGGLEIGYILAKKLCVPLDVIFVKKIGYPGNPELAIGSVGLDKVLVDAEYASQGFDEYVKDESERLKDLLKQRECNYRKVKRREDLRGKIVILVDDGIATGRTVGAAVDLIRESGAEKIILAVPASSESAYNDLRPKVDKFIALIITDRFFGVSQFYKIFNQVKDEAAIELLKGANK